MATPLGCIVTVRTGPLSGSPPFQPGSFVLRIPAHVTASGHKPTCPGHLLIQRTQTWCPESALLQTQGELASSEWL